VNIEGELAKVIKPSSEINSGSLSKMGFTKIGGRWVSNDSDQAGPSGTHEDDEPEEAAPQDEPVVEAQEDYHNDTNMGERMTTMSPFERLMVNRMDTFVENQRNFYDMCESKFNNMDSRFSTLDEQIEEVHKQIMELQFEREDNPSFKIFWFLNNWFCFFYVVINRAFCLFDETNRGRSWFCNVLINCFLYCFEHCCYELF